MSIKEYFQNSSKEGSLFQNLKEKLFSNKRKELDQLKTSVMSTKVNTKVPERLVKDGELNESLFGNADEFTVLKSRAKKQMGKNLSENLFTSKTYEIPLIVKEITDISYGKSIENVPQNASYKKIADYIQTLISYLQSKGKTDGVKKYQEYLKIYYSDYTPTIDPHLMQSFAGKYDVLIEDFESKIASDLSFFLKKKLFECFYEGGLKLLCEKMKAPESEEEGSLLKSLEKEGKKLDKAKDSGSQEKIVKAEKNLIQEIYHQVSQYEDSANDADNYSFPSDVIKSKKMLCLSKTNLIHGLLDYFGIKNELKEPSQHIYNIVTLSNGEKYVVDARKNTEYVWEENKYSDTFAKKNLYETSSSLDSSTLMVSEMLHSMLDWGTSITNDDILSLEFSLQLNPDNVWAMISLGYCYEKLGTLEDQKTAYEKFKASKELLEKIVNNKKRSNLDYNYDKIFKNARKIIYQNLYALNKENNYEPDKLQNQKDKFTYYLIQ